MRYVTSFRYVTAEEQLRLSNWRYYNFRRQKFLQNPESKLVSVDRVRPVKNLQGTPERPSVYVIVASTICKLESVKAHNISRYRPIGRRRRILAVYRA